jgi:hypothetical protein
VARQDAGGEAEPVRGDRGVEGGAARPDDAVEAIEGDVPDGDEVRRAQRRVVTAASPWR